MDVVAVDFDCLQWKICGTVVRKIEGMYEIERMEDKFILEREGNTIEVNTSLFLGYND
jgi:hypothetical protein